MFQSPFGSKDQNKSPFANALKSIICKCVGPIEPIVLRVVAKSLGTIPNIATFHHNPCPSARFMSRGNRLLAHSQWCCATELSRLLRLGWKWLVVIHKSGLKTNLTRWLVKKSQVVRFISSMLLLIQPCKCMIPHKPNFTAHGVAANDMGNCITASTRIVLMAWGNPPVVQGGRPSQFLKSAVG